MADLYQVNLLAWTFPRAWMKHVLKVISCSDGKQGVTCYGFTLLVVHDGGGASVESQAHDAQTPVLGGHHRPVAGRPLDVDRPRDEVFGRPQLVDEVSGLDVPDGDGVVSQDEELHVAFARSEPDLFDVSAPPAGGRDGLGRLGLQVPNVDAALGVATHHVVTLPTDACHHAC